MPAALRLLLVVGLLAGDTAVIQAIGWASMLATRTVERGWRGAVASTFGGEEPCPLCCAATALREPRAPAAPEETAKQPIKQALAAHIVVYPTAALQCGGLPRTPGPAPVSGVRPAPDPPPPRLG